MRFIAEDEVDRKYAGLRLCGRSIGGRQQDEVDVAGLHLLQGLRFGAELGAGILIDRKRAFAQLHQLLVEHFGADTVAAAFRLVVSERELAVLGKRPRPSDGPNRQEEKRAKKRT